MSTKDAVSKSKSTKDGIKDSRKSAVLGSEPSSSTTSPDLHKKLKEAEKQRKKGNSSPVAITGSSPILSLGSGQTRPLPSGAGIKFDSYETLFADKKIEKDACQDLVSWPKDDISIEKQKRKMRTKNPPLPSDLKENEASYINTLTALFMKDWKVLKRPYLHHSLNSELADNWEELPEADYDADRALAEQADNPENKIEKSKDLAAYVGESRDPEAIRKEAKLPLKESRQTLLVTFPMELVPDVVDPRPKGKPLSDELGGTQIYVEPTELSFELGNHEPFFGTIALYDLKRKEKVSETWNFDLNPPGVTELLGPHCGNRDAATLAKSCIFTTSYYNPDIYMVIIISTILHGEESDAVAPYMNSKIKDKDREKFIQESRQSTLRLGGYRQPFGYAVIQMFDDNHSLKPAKDTVVTSLMRPKVERDVYNWIEKALDKSKGKSPIPVKLALTIKKLSEKDPLKGRLTPSLLPVKPTAKTADTKVIREMGDFSSSSPEGALRQLPNLSYENSLYFLPDSVNFSHVSGTSSRNIAIEVKLFADDKDYTQEGLPLLYGNSISPSMTTLARSNVFYHSKKPVFFDEVKVHLPTFLTSKHHLVVSFYHLTCAQQKAKPNQGVETLIGRSVVPIYPDSRLVRDGKYSIPVAVNLPTENYLSETPDASNSTVPVKWIDNGKAIFTFRLKTVSTIYPQDTALDEFFKQYELHKNGGTDEALITAIQGLARAEKQKVIEYFPAVLNLLFRIMSNAGTNLQTHAFTCVVNIVDIVHSNSYNNSLLESYVHYLFENQSSSKEANMLCEVMVDIWFYQIIQARSPSENVIKYAWFLFSVIFKSMVLYVLEAPSVVSRKERFTHAFVTLLNKLITQLAIKTKELCGTTYSPEGRKLYQYVALFLRDLFSIMDRGIVFEMIYRYVFELDPDNEATPVLVDFKFQFLKIICNHEHYIVLNLPIQDDLAGVTVSEIKTIFWRRHFLAGLLLDELAKCMTKPTSDRRVTAINTLKDLLWKHDHDPRYNNPSSRERIAQIYFPYVLLVIDNWHTMKENQKSYTFIETRSWLVCFLWVLKNINRQMLQNWWKRDTTPKRKKALLDILADCLLVFEYAGISVLTKRGDSDTKSNSDSVQGEEDDDKKRRKHAKVKKATRSFGSHHGAMHHIRSDTKTAIENYYSTRTQSSNDMTFDPTSSILTLPAIIRKEQNLGKEVAITILDIMTDFINDHRTDLIKRENVESDKFEPEKLFEKAFDIFIRILQCNQAKPVLVHLFKQLQWIIPRFRTPLFKFRSAVCGALTYEIIKHSNSKWAQVRALSCGVILLMIKHNYEEVKNFSRMKLQSTVAISQLFATPALDHGADPLKDSLSAIRTHALNRFNKEKTKHGTLGTEVKELIARLDHVIEDNLKMEEYSFDPETKADLYHQISRGYADSPDLRNTELEKLANMHMKDGNYEECALVRITQAILVGEYLRMLGRMGTEAMPTNSTQVFPNLTAEISLPKKQELETLELEICQSRVFTEEGFVMLLAQAVEKLKLQFLFESSVEVYRLLLPIYQFRRNYLKQAECYADLQELCQASVQQMQTNNRIFAQYYRVAFFGGGDKLQELDGQQYIYKEHGSVRLDGITERLTEQFSNKIARENIHFASNINFERASMQVGHLYIQLVSVEPYITANELESKPTLFEQHFNVSSFIYETPFTKSKEKSEKLSDQWKRKTILKVDGSFPCLKKRLAVKEVQVVELSPIETATELITKKAQALQAELVKMPVNTKTLQRELQGTLLLQVNAGPAAIATEFLETKEVEYPAALKQKLGAAFIAFVRLLAEGVAVNNQMITVEQLTLQSELKNGYFRLKSLVCRLTNTAEESIEETFSPELPTPTSTSPSGTSTPSIESAPSSMVLSQPQSPVLS